MPQHRCLLKIYKNICGSYIYIFFSPVGKIDIGHVRLNFWDLGGQEELQSLWDKVSGGGGVAVSRETEN